MQLLLLLALAALLAAPAARAASCTVSATSIAFGTYTPLQATALDSNGTIAIACTGVVFETVTIDLSTGASGNYTTRTLVSGTATLSYNLYTNAATTTIFGNGTGGSSEGQALIWFLAENANVTVYGAVAAGQDPAPGTYTDTITVTVNY